MKRKIIIVGGGTGSAMIIQGLKRQKDLQLFVVVGMADDGGSNAVIRDEIGMLPVSDLRKTIIALAADNNKLVEIFKHRFSKAKGLKGHTLGNLVVIALNEESGSLMKAIDQVNDLLGCTGQTIPVTLDDCRLAATYEDGTEVVGEHYIDEPEKPHGRIVKFEQKPPGSATKEATEAIKAADLVIVGPGDLYTTTLATLTVGGIPEAIQKRKGEYVFVLNLMEKKGQTDNMTAKDQVAEVTKYVGVEPDIVLVNNSPIPSGLLTEYKKRGENPVKDDLEERDYKVIRADLLKEEARKKQRGDDLVRSALVHDSEKVASCLLSLF